MAPQEKKWDDRAERDLCIAIIQGNQESAKNRYNWPRIEVMMTKLGHTFTKDAMSQHFSKTILKEFRARCPEDETTETPPASATKPKTPRKSATPSKRRARGGAKGKTADAGDDEDDDVDVDATPTKKVKKENKSATVKKEEAATPSAAADNDDKLNGCDTESSDTKP
ncbi:hypothetical protein V8C42DRAFT_88319 [Trichoderma barbatum]